MNKRITARILKKAIVLLEQGWCQNSYAQTQLGIPCTETSPDAVSFCATGALYRACSSNSNYEDVRTHMLKFLPKKVESIVDLNDKKTTKKADVLRVFKRALRALEK